MNRRRYLVAASGIGATALSGCLGGSVNPLGGGGDSRNVYLEEPDRDFESSELPYPAYGQLLPEVTIRDPIAGRDVTLTEFDDRDVLLTYFYSNCNTVCPLLIATLRKIQTAAIEAGYGDEVAFLAITFDPKRDDAERLREYADVMNVDMDAGNWHFLRPESEERAKKIVQDEFGVYYEKTGATDSSGYMYNHLGAITLANRKGYVERAYIENNPKAEPIQEDLEKLREAES